MKRKIRSPGCRKRWISKRKRTSLKPASSNTRTAARLIGSEQGTHRCVVWRRPDGYPRQTSDASNCDINHRMNGTSCHLVPETRGRSHVRHLVPWPSDYDWLIWSQSRMGKFSGATSTWMLLATPG